MRTTRGLTARAQTARTPPTTVCKSVLTCGESAKLAAPPKQWTESCHVDDGLRDVHTFSDAILRCEENGHRLCNEDELVRAFPASAAHTVMH